MRINLPVTAREREYPAAIRLISETDPKGVITYVNDAFCEVSGFSREELIGQPHNLIRHPDMPPEVYTDFWATLKAGRPWLGVVKNRCKNGDHYWASAYVTPVYDDGRMVGYQSVRTAPARALVERAERLYAGMRRRQRAPRRQVGHYGLWSGQLAVAGLIGGLLIAGLPPLPQALAAAAAALGLIGAAQWLNRRLRQAEVAAKAIFDNRLAARVVGGGEDEAANLQLALAMERARETALRGRVEDAIEPLAATVRSLEGAAGHTDEVLAGQRQDIEQVVAAMQQMANAVQEVSRNSQTAAAAADGAVEASARGDRVTADVVAGVAALAGEIDRACGVIERLRRESDEVQTVLDVIDGISEQTNLLALNAAIEAARAGEHGRGFSVVAEEVRALAQRAGESTRTIAEIVARLRGGAAEAVTVMDGGRDSTQRLVGLAEEAGSAIQAMAAAVTAINELNTQIAGAAEQQAATTADISRNATAMRDGVQATAAAAGETKAASAELVALVTGFRNLLRQFRR